VQLWVWRTCPSIGTGRNEARRLARRRYAPETLKTRNEREKTFLTEDAKNLIAADGMDVIVEATGVPAWA